MPYKNTENHTKMNLSEVVIA